MALELIVEAGDVERIEPFVTAPVAAGQLVSEVGPGVLGRGPGGEEEGGACLLADLDGAGADGRAVAQYDAGRQHLSFVVPGAMRAGDRRRFAVLRESPGVRPTASAPFPVACREKLDRLVIGVGGEPFATYNLAGARRPYFWPVLGPSGASVVRGQGTVDHPHHTGMGLSYGGHSEGGSSNIWSDWDEPPYGPGGRMLHRGCRKVTGGPVYAEIVEDLTYVNAFGDPIVDETRIIRCWWASQHARFLDFWFLVREAVDTGPQPFLFMIRLPDSFDIPKTGRVTNAIGHPVPHPEGLPQYPAAWVDGSGPTAGPPALPATAPPEVLVDLPGYEPPPKGPATGPWNGIALFDHPSNTGFPNTIGKYAVPRQITQIHYPPRASPFGPFQFRHRVYVHDGDAEAAKVALRAADYARPCAVSTRPSDE